MIMLNIYIMQYNWKLVTQVDGDETFNDVELYCMLECGVKVTLGEISYMDNGDRLKIDKLAVGDTCYTMVDSNSTLSILRKGNDVSFISNIGGSASGSLSVSGMLYDKSLYSCLCEIHTFLTCNNEQ